MKTLKTSTDQSRYWKIVQSQSELSYICIPNVGCFQYISDREGKGLESLLTTTSLHYQDSDKKLIPHASGLRLYWLDWVSGKEGRLWGGAHNGPVRKHCIYTSVHINGSQGAIVSGHVLITSYSASYFVDALRCVRAADQNVAFYNHPLKNPKYFIRLKEPNFDSSPLPNDRLFWNKLFKNIAKIVVSFITLLLEYLE